VVSLLKCEFRRKDEEEDRSNGDEEEKDVEMKVVEYLVVVFERNEEEKAEERTVFGSTGANFRRLGPTEIIMKSRTKKTQQPSWMDDDHFFSLTFLSH
jgi:hypothetical protein